MSKSLREVIESPVEMGTREVRTFTITTTPQASSPAAPANYLYRLPDWTDVSATYLSGSASATGDVITTKAVSGLVADTKYVLETTFTASGQTISVYTAIICQRP